MGGGGGYLVNRGCLGHMVNIALQLLTHGVNQSGSESKDRPGSNKSNKYLV